MRLQRVTMTTGINPRDAEECQQSWIYISRDKNRPLCCLVLCPDEFLKSSCAELNLTKLYQIYIYVQVYLN